MKKIISFMCTALLAGTAAFATPAFAEDAKPAAPLISADDIKKALGMSIYLQSGYTYNGNASAGQVNDWRVFDQPANSFGLDLAEIVFSKDPSTCLLGYKVKVSAGETAKFIHAAGLGTQPTGTYANPESFDITEAYVSYSAPIGKGLRFDIGKMVTFFGAEVIEAIDNPNYSRSFLFNYAIPFTHTGAKASYAFNDNVNAALFVVNGWDNATDNNMSKSVGVSVNIAAGDPFSAYINYMTGPEEANNSSNSRSLLDLVATIKPLKPLSIILNYDNATEAKVPGTLLPSGITSDARWNGFAGIVKYDFTDMYSLSVRAESFDDADGFRTGIKQTLTEVTVTPELRLAGGLILRPEYRHDSSDKRSFDNGTKKSQDTLALGAMYRW
ncbi:MAG: porin [Nitrospiraceae bacterium]|nr:porin [Nitrospiraceae bacterium]